MFARLVGLGAVFMAWSGTAAAEPLDWKGRLSASLVQVENGEMSWRSVQLCRNEATGKSFQVQSTAKAPEGVGISRDFFLSFASSTDGLMMGILLGAVAGATNDRSVFDSVKCKEIESVIGKADMTIDLSMTGDGWQMEMAVDGTTTRHTERWADSFAE